MPAVPRELVHRIICETRHLHHDDNNVGSGRNRAGMHGDDTRTRRRTRACGGPGLCSDTVPRPVQHGQGVGAVSDRHLDGIVPARRSHTLPPCRAEVPRGCRHDGGVADGRLFRHRVAHHDWRGILLFPTPAQVSAGARKRPAGIRLVLLVLPVRRVLLRSGSDVGAPGDSRCVGAGV